MNVSLLKKICEAPGVPGYEHAIRKIIYAELEGEDLDIHTDNIGNVIVHRKGKSSDKKVMVAAHMDEIGFMITHIDDNGFLYFNTLGGFDPKTLTAQRVIVHGKQALIGVMGSKPIHMMTPEEKSKPAKLEDFYIDMGMNADDVKANISVGDVVTRERELIEMGDCVNCKSLDNRVSVFILLESLKSLKETPYDVFGVFTVQEEVGIRGAGVSALKIQPDFGIGLDTTIAYDVPGAKEYENITKLGKGVGIKIMDASALCDYRMIDYMKNLVADANIVWQPEIMLKGGTDTSGIQRMTGGGAICGAISIPTRHIHQVIEMCSKSDIGGAIQLLNLTLEKLDSHDWAHTH